MKTEKAIIVVGSILIGAIAVAAPWTKDPAENRPALFKTFGDNDGAMGLLDQPSELIYLPDGRLVVVNIDAPSAGMVNSGADAVHTLCVIK